MEELFELHKRILDEMHELYCRKNQDYGNSTHETYLKFGTAAYLVRMYDKLNRLYALTQKGANARVTDESIHDTLKDLANYAILMSMELKLENKGVVKNYD
jgi:hypothetical protein